jgi:predicted oxidoreductase
MERIQLSEGLSLSRIAYGMWRMAEACDTSPGHIRQKIEACLSQGITTMDQADIYGDYSAEGLLGACLHETPGLRDRIEIVTKCDIVAPCGRYADRRVKYYDTSAAHIMHSVDTSLTQMATDRIDLLLIHRPDPLMDPHETGHALDQLVACGKVRAVGVSNFKPHDFSLLQSAMATPLRVNQIEISLSAHEAFTNGDIAFLQERNLSPMAWSPLGGGRMMRGENPRISAALQRIGAELGADASAVAVAWLLRHPAGILPVMGSNRLDRISAFSDALAIQMDRQTWFELYTAAIGQEVA